MFTMGTTTGVQNIAKDMVIAVNLRYSFNRCSSGISFFLYPLKVHCPDSKGIILNYLTFPRNLKKRRKGINLETFVINR